jgi:hypothetical protein
MSLFMQQKAHQQTDEQAHQQSWGLMPEAWYEKRLEPTVLYVVLVVSMYFLTFPQYRFAPPTWLSIFSMVIYISGWATDMTMTWRCFRLRPLFERRQMRFPLRESSVFVKEGVTLRRVLASPSTPLVFMLLLASWFVPGVGIAAGIAHFVAAANNHRKTNRLLLQMRLFDGAMRQGEKRASLQANRPETHSVMLKSRPVIEPF